MNCPQHIRPRFTKEEVGSEIERLKSRIRELETAGGKGAALGCPLYMGL